MLTLYGAAWSRVTNLHLSQKCCKDICCIIFACTQSPLFVGLLVNWLCSYPREWGLQLSSKDPQQSPFKVQMKPCQQQLDIFYEFSLCNYVPTCSFDGIVTLMSRNCVANQRDAKSLYNCMLFNNFFIIEKLMKVPI